VHGYLLQYVAKETRNNEPLVEKSLSKRKYRITLQSFSVIVHVATKSVRLCALTLSNLEFTPFYYTYFSFDDCSIAYITVRLHAFHLSSTGFVRKLTTISGHPVRAEIARQVTAMAARARGHAPHRARRPRARDLTRGFVPTRCRTGANAVSGARACQGARAHAKVAKARVTIVARWARKTGN
jgi:hypothetical protein